MFDRENMIPLETAEDRIRNGSRFMPSALVPARADGSAPDRLLWGEFDETPFSSPFTDEDMHRRASQADWFMSRLEDVDRIRFLSNPLPLRGVVFHMSRCGSTLSRRLLGEVDGAFTLSEPGIVNSTIVGSAAPRFGGIFSAVLAGKSGRFEGAYLKCTSWNLLHGRTLLDALDGPPAIFIHRDPVEVLASLKRSNSDWHSRLFIGGANPELDTDPPPDPDTGNARFLAGLIESALELEKAGRLRFVAYEDILERFIAGDMPEHFGYEVDEATRTRMYDVAGMDSKKPGSRFTSDREEKRRIAEEHPAIRSAAAELEELHAEACRRSGHSGTGA
ncbi:MAG: hypothetical protein CMJ34_11210 [Phycisphaerae bacterium]|nr:hypothetical protein [Phycisphaerae bacterium]